MAKFTEGEWAVNTTGSKTWVDTETGLTVAQVFDMEGHTDNAHLIAAAPDMYKEIELDLNRLKGSISCFTGYHLTDIKKHIARKEKLLARARGEL